MDVMTDNRLHPIKIWNSIRGRLFLLTTAVLALALTALGLFILNLFRSHLLNDKRMEIFHIAEKTSELVESHIDDIIDKVVKELFSGSRIWLYEKGRISDIRPDLEALLGKLQDVQSLSISDIWGNRLIRVLREDPVSKDILKEKANEEKIKSAIEDNVYIGNVYPAGRAAPMVDISVPLTAVDGNAARHILTVTINLNGIYKILEEIELDTVREIFIVDTNGWVITYLSRTIGLKTPGIKGVSSFWGNIGHIKKVRDYLSGLSEMSFKKPVIYKNMHMEDVLGVVAVCSKLKWGVIVEEPLNTILDPVGPMMNRYIIAAVLVFILFSIFIFILIGFATTPLMRLYRSTQTLRGETGLIPFQGDDEAGRIALNINSLIKEWCKKDEHLRQRYKDMETVMNKEFEQTHNRLEQLTEELNASKEELLKEKGLADVLTGVSGLFIVGLDLHGRVIIINKKCEEMLKFRSEEITGKGWFDLVYPSGARDLAEAHFRDALDGNTLEIVEDQILTKDGQPLNISWLIRVINDSNGMAERVILIGEDTGQKHKMEEELLAKNAQLVKNNEELENVLSIVSHDLKNPLYILKDFASILLQDYQDVLNEDGLYYLERIKANAEHMEKLIVDLLELSRTSRVKGDWQECVISDIVNRAIEEFQEKIKDKGIRISVSGHFPICVCEPERILQVFMNLLSNAIKFMSSAREPVIEIGYKDTKNEHEFYLKDNGIGIDKENHEKIFVIFQRVQDVEGIEGTGVGLTIVKKIVEDHGGRVWVESEKGKGSTFYFTISKAITKSAANQRLNQTQKKAV
ncbi:PAS domain-containing protein [bacterium]|nr:PAS domain-containing protein [bacterium]